jgi:phosphoribosyl-ATP pyrophosphohydrolase
VDDVATAQLSVRSARARELAHKLSHEEKRPIHSIVEEALETYAATKKRKSFQDLLARLQALSWPKEDGEVDLDEVMAELDQPHQGLEL